MSDSKIADKSAGTLPYVAVVIFSGLAKLVNGSVYILLIFYLGAMVSGEKIPSFDAVLFFAAVFLFKAGFAWTDNFFSMKIAVSVKRTMRIRIFKKLKGLGPGYLEYFGTADITANIVDGVEAMEIFYGRFIPQLIYSITIPFVLFLVCSRLNLSFAWVMLASVPLIPFALFLVSYRNRGAMKQFWVGFRELSSFFLENLQGMLTLQMLGKSRIRFAQQEKKSWDFRNTTMKLLRVQLSSIALMDTGVYLFAGVGIAFAVKGFIDGNIDTGSLFVLIMLSVEFFLPVRKLGSLFHAGINGIQAKKEIDKFLMVTEPNAGVEPVVFSREPGLEIKDLNYSYTPGSPSVLSDISFRFCPGKIYGIKGVSGSGKSTLGRLMLGFHTPSKGEIFLDGVLLSRIPVRQLRSKITLIDSASHIFSATIRDNLLMANPSADERSMKTACKKAGLSSLLNKNNGLDTRTGEAGKLLSGGEKQRLAIARAILLDPDIFVFDEAAGSVDAESETVIKSAIRDLSSGKIIILISHRESMISIADEILTLKKGTLEPRAQREEVSL